ncbi:MAG: hypothetical protein VX589_08965 [Myxococcota bacterium]|nr:hypothetical protein [Myxococcota bacterium]
MKRLRLRLVLSLSLLCAPWTASADLVSAWIAAKGAYINGTGKVYENLDNRFGGGVEFGLELLGIDFPMIEAYILGPDQYMFTGNVGFDVGFGDDVRFTIGVYTGPILFILPEPNVEEISVTADDFIPADVSATERAALEAMYGPQAQAFQDQYNETVVAEEGEYSKYAVGWNLIRARFQLDYKVAPVVFFGLEGAFGYHYMLSGEDAVAETKRRALSQTAADQDPPLPAEVEQQLADRIGAREIEASDLSGMNYNIGIYLKLDL